MKVEFHVTHYRESLDAIELAIERGLERNQRSIGFHTSAASVDLLSLYLFQERLITPGTQIQHSWFRSEVRAREHLAMDFPDKDRVFELMAQIEAARDGLCYGRPRPIDEVQRTIETFQKLRTLFEAMGLRPDET